LEDGAQEVNSITSFHVVVLFICFSVCTQIDMVVNPGKVLSEDWPYVKEEIKAINSVVVERNGLLKVIFANDYLQDQHIVKLCGICSEIGVAFVKTSTGFFCFCFPS
jgi:deoxyribose-phosphate aldolase